VRSEISFPKRNTNVGMKFAVNRKPFLNLEEASQLLSIPSTPLFLFIGRTEMSRDPSTSLRMTKNGTRMSGCSFPRNVSLLQIWKLPVMLTHRKDKI